MRKESQFTLVALLVVSLCGCAPKLKSAGKSSPSTNSFSWKKASTGAKANKDALGNSQSKKSTWQKMTSAFASKKKPTTTSKSSPETDPLHLSNKPGRPTPNMHVSMGKLLERAGDADRAAEHFGKALALDPRNLAALLEFAHLLDRQGRLPEAAEKYQLACKYHPQASAALNDYGLCLARMNRMEEAYQSLRQAIALQPKNPRYSNNIATVLVELSRPDEALHYLKAAHGDVIAHYNVGHLLQSNGQTAPAAHHFSQAAALDPNFAPAREWASRLAAAPPASTEFRFESPSPAKASIYQASRPTTVVGPRYAPQP